MPKVVSSIEHILEEISTPEGFSLNLDGIKRGIDNYRIDVALSPNFEFVLRELIEVQVRRVIAGARLITANADEMIAVRDSYVDVMKTTFHRSKTDLTIAEIRVLQFAVVKFVIAEVRKEVDEQAAALEETLANQQSTGNKNLLSTQTRVTWFRRYREEFQFNVIRAVLRVLQREEANVLKPLRNQLLGSELEEAFAIMFNPMLYARGPNDPMLQLEFYTLWPEDGTKFAEVNAKFERMAADKIPGFTVTPLLPKEAPAPDQVEPMDELGGLFALQASMGASVNQGDVIEESLCTLEDPENMVKLFDEKVLEKHIANGKDTLGMTGSWGLKSDIKKLQKVRNEFVRSLDKAAVKLMFATYLVREKMEQQDFSLIKSVDAIEAVAGINTKKILAAISTDMEGATALRDKLTQLSGEADKRMKQMEDEFEGKILADYSRFRLHLKYFRFAQRVFNRINLITDEESLQLSRSSGNLYQIWDSEEVKEDTAEDDVVARYTILKADIRGAQRATKALLEQGLNPASYFSLNFFNPINDVLETYGAQKVMVDGDSVTLAFYEYEGEPANWFSVSRACGVAKEILDIVASQNTTSSKTGLPPIELGIGIFLAAGRPLFLFDDDRPIMVSSAIARADKLSDCSWKLRELIKKPDFNVEVYEAPDMEDDRGQKPLFMNFNRNGILLDERAFKKLKTEVDFSKLSITVADEPRQMFVGRFPDVKGKERSLVVREGDCGIFRNGAIDEEGLSASMYYEVIPNSKLSMQIVKLAEKKG